MKTASSVRRQATNFARFVAFALPFAVGICATHGGSLSALNGREQGGNQPTAIPAIQWSATVPSFTSVVAGACTCLRITPNLDADTLVVANRCSDKVTILAAREGLQAFVTPFLPIGPSPGREFARVDINTLDFAELSGPQFTGYYVVPLTCAGAPTTQPYLRCSINQNELPQGTPPLSCDVTGKPIGDACTCAKNLPGMPPPGGDGTYGGRVAMYPRPPQQPGQ